MDIKKEVINALRNRKDDEFNLGEELIIDGVNLGKMRSMIGYRGLDLASDVDIKIDYVDGFKSYIYNDNTDSNYTLFYLHGGGFYGGSAIVYEYICKYIAKYANIRVINMEYPLAPEMKFPDTSRLVYSVIKQYAKKYENNIFSIAGDSAGAHISMNVVQEDVLDKKLISFLTMYYPCMSLSKLENWSISKYNLDEDSHYAKINIKFLRSLFPFIEKFYVKKGTNKNTKEYNFNLMTEKDFSKLPSMMIIKAQYDYCNLEIDEFIEKFGVKSYVFEGMPHGFMELLGYVEEVKKALDLTIENIKISRDKIGE
ncbi:alpha/beta hydrolase fold domain-containing protein [Oceanivirga miroungae]|uniref:Alpha/beta hydrolase n=1 Tax=Oceanivirga miroungae TaxID=1130046 RepID=A0A6I8M8N4_9FUSO|nr:alpha/beta hydrolase fold domain-containing protein [Oceanivirga miroungae]VWL85854.1 alpha/beta hydrolase [Oceanivirga miroungae]